MGFLGRFEVQNMCILWFLGRFEASFCLQLLLSQLDIIERERGSWNRNSTKSISPQIDLETTKYKCFALRWQMFNNWFAIWQSSLNLRCITPFIPGSGNQKCYAAAYFPFVIGRCHLKRSLPFLRKAVAIWNGWCHFSSFESHSLGLRTQKVAVTGSCVSLVIWVRVRVRVLFRVRAKNPSSESWNFRTLFFPQVILL